MNVDLPAADAPALLDVLEVSTERLLTAVEELPTAELLGPSALPDWDRVTVLTHLRFVAAASRRITTVALTGEGDPAMYPGGRRTRPATLERHSGEAPEDVVASLRAESDGLHAAWSALDAKGWSATLDEPDLGHLPLSRLLVLRLTEIEVHSVDLDLPGLDRWTDAFAEAALPLRVAWLPRLRRRPDADLTVDGTWRLTAGTGNWLLTTEGTEVDVRPATAEDAADAVLAGTDAELLALLLGRGDPADAAAARFKRAFPGP